MIVLRFMDIVIWIVHGMAPVEAACIGGSGRRVKRAAHRRHQMRRPGTRRRTVDTSFTIF